VLLEHAETASTTIRTPRGFMGNSYRTVGVRITTRAQCGSDPRAA
jgi:hypothetical protein